MIEAASVSIGIVLASMLWLAVRVKSGVGLVVWAVSAGSWVLYTGDYLTEPNLVFILALAVMGVAIAAINK